jgi:hypothetical protein
VSLKDQKMEQEAKKSERLNGQIFIV